MEGFNSHTKNLANLLTQSHSGFKWCLDFFHDVRYAIWIGNYPDLEQSVRDSFRKALSRGGTAMPILSFSDEAVNWKELYDYIFEITNSKEKFSNIETERLAMLTIYTPNPAAWAINFFVKNYKPNQPVKVHPKRLLNTFKSKIREMVLESKLINLDLSKVDWMELYIYVYEQEKKYIDATGK